MSKQKVNASELNAVMPPAMEDTAGFAVEGTTVSSDYIQATQNTAGVPMGALLAAAGNGASAFEHEGDVLTYNSQGIVEPANIAYTETKMNEMRGFGEVMAAQQCQGVQQFANPQYKEELKSIAKRAASLAGVDTVTYSEGQRIVLEPQVTSVPVTLVREQSLKDLRMLLGETRENQTRTIEVLKWARSAGVQFVKLPMLWLSQQLALESKRNTLYEDMPADLHETSASDNEAVVKLIASLFSAGTARNIQMLGRLHRVSTLAVFRYLVAKICQKRADQVIPENAVTTEFDDLAIQVAV